MLHDALLPAFTGQKTVEVFVKEKKKKETQRGKGGVLCGGEWKRERMRL